ncbi:poly polymerase catalytic domain-containing protein [Glomus cerebriforme]|uniref:Poly [ADP-ribose] polymerase n=1 Tax=Glomus cerebriforme TaxID=658196 RepID=A0A397TF07_9GLOM|nr:poly polymerase catalytic domain-containing protein [Glomus cerebriforme]
MEDANDDSTATRKHKQYDDNDDQVDDDVYPSRKRRRAVKRDVGSDIENNIKDQNSITITTTSTVQETTISSKKRKEKQIAKIATISTDNQDQNDETVLTQVVQEKKMVKVVIKGKAPVDGAFSNKNSVHVYSDEEVVWDALLNCTNIGNNNNKFYVIQLLQTDSFKEYYVFSKWGRVGYESRSQTGCFGPTASLDDAKREFIKKFKSKTGNNWLVVCQDISKFVPNNGKYTLLKRDYDEDEGDDEQVKKKAKDKKEKSKSIPESNLHPKVQDIMQMVFDVNQWKESMKEFEYDSVKLPLGKIGKSTINQGYNILKRIETVLLGNSTEDLESLSNEFYSVIPHYFGMKKPLIIDSPILLKSKLEMVETLGEIEIATSLKNECDSMDTINPLDAHYKTLKLERMEPLDHGSKEFEMIVQYVNNTHGATHSHFKLEVMEVFDLERKGERERFQPFSKLKNRVLLWHGSRKTNFAGILSQGLRIAPPNAPVTGYMFGKGVYFADIVSKSAQYVHCTSHDNIGLMLLNEVALGDMLELEYSDFEAGIKAKKQSKHSVKGCGRICPDPKGFNVLENGCIIPCGKGIEKFSYQSLFYNEYIVYDEAQIMQKYLIKMKFKYSY